MSAIITIEFTVPVGFIPADYARLFGNGGSGDINYETPLSNDIFELFPSGVGIYGFGHAPFGHHRFGHCHSMRTAGFGHMPFGHHPFGHGSAVITATYIVTQCGDYKFAFQCYDAAGNVDEGDPEETTVVVHIAPAAPTGLAKNSYDKTTDVLVLGVAA